MFICAAWRRRLEGPMDSRRTLVTRCDLEEGHEGDHVDKVLLVNWPDSESDPECRPRNEWNEPSVAIALDKGEPLEEAKAAETGLAMRHVQEAQSCP